MKKNFFLLLAITTLALFNGCQRLPERPDGMPELTPCVIEVTFGGEKLSEVGILLQAKNKGANAWSAGGKTDAEGKAVMMTAAHYKGVAQGEYVVSFEKFAPEEMRRDGMPLPAKPLVPLKYSQRQSKETVTVTKEQSVYTFELERL